MYTIFSEGRNRNARAFNAHPCSVVGIPIHFVTVSVVCTVVMILLYVHYNIQRPRRNFISCSCTWTGEDILLQCFSLFGRSCEGPVAHMRSHIPTHARPRRRLAETPKNRFADSGWSMGFSVTHYCVLYYIQYIILLYYNEKKYPIMRIEKTNWIVRSSYTHTGKI